MRFDTSQQMKLGQQMKLTPRMIQSMEILQMPLAELRERIEQELESNPTLEVNELDPSLRDASDYDERLASSGELDITNDSASDFARLDEYTTTNPDAADNTFDSKSRSTDYADRAPRASSGDRDAKMDAMSQAPARSASLTEQLLDQWALTSVDDRIRPLGELIIAALDDDGYLRTSIEDIADRAPQPVKAIEPTETDWEFAVQAVQLLLEPVGVAARDARECLLIQIDALSDRITDEHRDDVDSKLTSESLEVARTLVAEFFEELMKNKLPKIAAKGGLTLDEINAGIEALRRLSLAPARRLVDDAPHAISPDAIVEYDEEEDRYLAYLTDGRLPDVQINREYARMAADKAVPKDDRNFLRKNLSNAQWLIDAVGQRQHTLLRVVNAVVDEQRDYFDFGPEALKPLPMKTIADRLGIHVATVSRAVSEKYIMTPRGTVALRGFFSGGLATDSGEDVSSNAVKAAIQELVDNENKAKPLSDEAMVKALKENGIEIARRTVAKYRDQLKIPTARMRKQF